MKHTVIVFLFSGLLMLGGYTIVSGQKAVVNYLDVGVSNATVLSEQYMLPFVSMLDASLTGGWNMAPRVQRSGKFTLHVFMNQSYRESGDNLMSIGQMIDNNQLTNISIVDPAVDNAPTAVYKMKAGQDRPILRYQSEQLTAPNGDDIGSVQLPVLAFSIGIPAATELSVKFTPPMDYSSLGEVLQYGVGVKHSIKDYIGFLQRSPYLEAAVMATYSNVTSENEVSYKEQSGQTMNIKGSALSGRFLMGLHFNKADIYGSIGYGSRKSQFNLNGTFENVPDENGDATTEDDPIEVDYDFSGLEYEAGVQLRLYFLNLQAGYSYSNYSMVSLGVGFSF